MSLFRLSDQPLETEALRAELLDPSAGGFVVFEGWVRNHNEGQAVTRLEYEAFPSMALKQGERLVAKAIGDGGAKGALCVHRVGSLEIGDMAVWVGVTSAHRDEAFTTCRAIIDTIKVQVPIWKKEHYVSGDSGWVNCERCHGHATEHVHGSAHPHGHA